MLRATDDAIAAKYLEIVCSWTKAWFFSMPSLGTLEPERKQYVSTPDSRGDGCESSRIALPQGTTYYIGLFATVQSALPHHRDQL